MILNLYDYINAGTYYGLTVTKNADGSVTVSGEPNVSTAAITNTFLPLNLPNGTTLSAEYSQGVRATLRYKAIGSEAYSFTALTGPRTIDLDNNTNYEIYIEVIRATFVSPVTFYPEVRVDLQAAYSHKLIARRRLLLGGKKYLFVNYIESHGAEYFEFDFKTKHTQKYELEYSDVPSGGAKFIETGKAYQYVVYMNENHQQRVYAKANGQQGSDMMFDTYITNNSYHRIITLSYLYGKLVVKNGNTVIGTWETNGSAVGGDDNLYNLRLLARNWGGATASNFAMCRVYGFKVWENNVLIRDFKPCVRKADGAVGLYDEVTKTFYGNAGTGAFTYG